MINKKGQLNISFGAIFSIIIIVATLAVASYVIYNFIKPANEVKCGMFYQGLQEKINAAWSSDGETSLIYSNQLPSKAQKVCFGYTNQTVLNSEDKEIYELIKKTGSIKENFYIYPFSSCGETRYKYEIKNTAFEGFFCVDANSGKASVRISKEIGKKVIISE